MSKPKFKIGVVYAFLNEEAEHEYSAKYEQNKDFAELLAAHGDTFTVCEYNDRNGLVSSVIFGDGTVCTRVYTDELVIFNTELRFFKEVGERAPSVVIPPELVMNISIHSRGQAIAAIAAIQGAYQC